MSQHDYEASPVSFKWRKKPVEIEAFQMTKESWNDNESLWPNWLLNAYATKEVSPREDGLGFKIGTLEGPHLGDWDDYILQGVMGELYACKPDIFLLTYEKV